MKAGGSSGASPFRFASILSRCSDFCLWSPGLRGRSSHMEGYVLPTVSEGHEAELSSPGGRRAPQRRSFHTSGSSEGWVGRDEAVPHEDHSKPDLQLLLQDTRAPCPGYEQVTSWTTISPSHEDRKSCVCVSCAVCWFCKLLLPCSNPPTVRKPACNSLIPSLSMKLAPASSTCTSAEG